MEKAKDPNFGPAYEKRSRDHNERHNGAKNDLVELLNRNGRRSYTSLGKALNKVQCEYHRTLLEKQPRLPYIFLECEAAFV
jgi:hypothetical protein